MHIAAETPNISVDLVQGKAIAKNKNLFLEFWVTATNTYKREIRLEIGVEPVSPQNIIANQDNNAPQDNKTISDFENNI